MKINDLENSMGNTELRLSLATIETEIGAVKGIALEGLEQSKKTNGRVNKHDHQLWLALGALPLLTLWAGWLTNEVLHPKPNATPEQIQAAVAGGIKEALDAYEQP